MAGLPFATWLAETDGMAKRGRPVLLLVSRVFLNVDQPLANLRGIERDFHRKQAAQTLLRDLDGVGEINNRLEVAASLSAGLVVSYRFRGPQIAIVDAQQR